MKQNRMTESYSTTRDNDNIMLHINSWISQDQISSFFTGAVPIIDLSIETVNRRKYMKIAIIHRL